MRSLCVIFAVIALAGCGRSVVSVQINEDNQPAKAAEFKKGQGLLLSLEAVEFIGLRKAEAEVKADRIVLPAPALLRTSEGAFVFAQNGQRWLRTQVRVSAESAGMAEIADGLLEGDVVAVAGVWDLWLAELQAIKGGVGCADGH